MATTSTLIRRGLLYVPASSRKMLEKSRGLKVDCVAYDLEDSVAPSKKSEARKNLRATLDQPRASGIHEQAARINSVDSGYALDDLTEVLQANNLDTIVIPKVDSASDLHFVTDVIRHMLPHRHSSGLSTSDSQKKPVNLIALIESAKAITNLSSICQATPHLSGLIFAAEDFANDMNLTRTSSLTEFLYARSAMATACKAYNVPSVIDLVCTSYKGAEGQATLREECIGGKGLGFNGKQLIHPSQVDIAQAIFAPEEKEVEWAVRVVIADSKADKQGRGAWTLDDKMIDVPVVKKARAVLDRAQLCGYDVNAVRTKFADQEPE